MKKYVLGNYELSSIEIDLLKKLLVIRLDDNKRFTELAGGKVGLYYLKENEILNQILKELESYGD